ncbi:hypothetical protein [Mesorhizobium sp. L-8-10]|uniref:hypothetical protein n=1 Tax=Mesorhizobium sp. L-8-10 TaxID=2744523 RepID=UPI001926399F|nr:hypothetical protein [Mesorhizobium sp. L-8-10]
MKEAMRRRHYRIGPKIMRDSRRGMMRKFKVCGAIAFSRGLPERVGTMPSGRQERT